MNPNPPTSRRRFLQTSIALPAALTALGGAAPAAGQDAPAEDAADPVLPRRKLGRNGPEVTIVSLGGMMSAHSTQFLDIAWKLGIRFFDSARVYLNGRSEQNIAEWLRRYPERRKEVFITTKDSASRGPEQLLTAVDERLKACGTDYLDLFYMHGIGARSHGEESLEWPRSDRFKKVCEQLKESGKCRLSGFTCHDRQLTDYMKAAADGGFLDVIMLRYDPRQSPGSDMDQALEACHKAGIGLVAMKAMIPFRNAPRNNPVCEGLGLTTHQAVLHATWSDPRIAAACISMDNVQQIQENSEAARKFTGALPEEGRKALQEVAALSPIPMCPGCPSCEQYAKAGAFAFYDIARFVCYYEQFGNVAARQYYRELPDADRDAASVDLAALRDGCHYHVDYPEIARRAERYFA